MAKVVFISHAGADSPKATIVAGLLTQAEIDVRFDRQELSLGDSFLAFMESALSNADYCLLLWSCNAASTPWVRVEWEAALYRCIQEKQSFLVVGRLEDAPLPALLGPRLRVDLFPECQPGVGQIVGTWRADREAETQTQRPVASAAITNIMEQGPETVYITSDQFGITVPLDVNLEEPAGVYLDRIITGFKLPKVLDYEGRMGVRFSYRLMNGDQPLDRGIPLVAQNVKDKSVLWLETTMTPYSHSEAMRGTLGPAVFRGERSRAEAKERERVEALARQEYLTAIMRNGLGGWTSMERLPHDGGSATSP
jgi:hypothetical protein